MTTTTTHNGKPRQYPTADEVKAAASGQCLDLLATVAGIPPELLDGRHHSCPKCRGTDRFRLIDADAGAVLCNQCFNKSNGDIIAAVQWNRGIAFPEAIRLLADKLGMQPTNGRINGKSTDIIAAVAKSKRMPLDAFRLFGVTEAKRYGRTVARVDVYNATGEVFSYFDIATDGSEKQRKGLFKEGRGNSGMFFPGFLPQPGETWCLVEGVKDAAALIGLGLKAAGLPRSDAPVKFAKLFRDVNIIIIPDLDAAGLAGCDKTASRLIGVAASVRVARLPGEVRESKGADVRDVLAKHGREAVETAIAEAAAWMPTKDEPTNGETQAAEKSLSRDLVTNAVVVKFESRKETFPLTMKQIIERTTGQTDSWPRRIDKTLFVHDAKHGIGWLEKPPELFGWLASRVGRVQWEGGSSCVGRNEFFAELQRTATKYRSVESLPHEPIIPDHYYTCGQLAPGDGKTFRELLNRFAPASDIDRDLIQAAFMTPGWGGPVGCRPCFVITSDDGRGAGKSTVATMVGAVWGGVLSFSHNEDINKIKTRLLSPEALTRRVCLLDNVKSPKFSWGELEGMITATEIGGHRMYVGEATRPNTLTWFVTLNGAALSTDMAQRAVIVKIKRPSRSATWEEDTRRFIEANRERIIADIIAALRANPYPLSRFSRWATWEKDILQRLPEPTEAQGIIAERQGSVDVDLDDADLLEEFFAEQLSRLHYRPHADQVFLPSQVVAKWFNVCHNDHQKTGQVSRAIGQLIDEGSVKRLQRNKCNTWGRGFVWCGSEAEADETIRTDIHERISRQGGQRWDS